MCARGPYALANASSAVVPTTSSATVPTVPTEPAVADRLSRRFREGRPSSDLREAGILLHMFDQGETAGVQAYASGALEVPAWAYDPWMPCPDTMWCAQYRDRMASSLLNKRTASRGGTSLFGNVGVVYAPALTEIWCSFVGDGGTFNADSSHGCHSAERGWCNPSAQHNDHQCPWRPENLKEMLELFEENPFGYNEVLVSTNDWEARMPEQIEAILWVDGGGGEGGGEAAARGVHAGFLRRYPHASPRLVSLDLSRLDTPFAPG